VTGTRGGVGKEVVMVRSWHDRVRAALSRRLGLGADVEWGYWPLEEGEELWSDQPDESEDRKLTGSVARLATSRTRAPGRRAGGAAAAGLLVLLTAACAERVPNVTPPAEAP
jgi:hypothetical protein